MKFKTARILSIVLLLASLTLSTIDAQASGNPSLISTHNQLQTQDPNQSATVQQLPNPASFGGNTSRNSAVGASNFNFEVIPAPPGFEEWTSPVV